MNRAELFSWDDSDYGEHVFGECCVPEFAAHIFYDGGSLVVEIKRNSELTFRASVSTGDEARVFANAFVYGFLRGAAQ